MSGIKSVSLLLLGAAIGAGAVWQLAPSAGMSAGDSTASGEKQPLYWVAPMDPNYRRDKPGKSPMGMDLIPVYEEDQGGGEMGAGTIKISPEVVNNLGVRLGNVTRESLNVSVNTVGYLKYNQDALVHVHPRVEGWIEKAYVKTVGEKVAKGAPLYTLYSPMLVNAQEEFLFALSTGDKRLQAAATARLKAYKMTDGFIETLRKQRKVKQTVEFLSPADGVIDTFNLTEGMFIKPGVTVLSIASLDQMWVDAEVFERQSAWVKEGQPASMTLEAYPGEQWQGEVDYIYPSLSEKTRTLRVRLRFDNPEHRLKPNMFARLHLQGVSDQAVLAVPQNAVIRGSGDSRVVLALGEGRFKSIAVKTGRSDGRMTEVLAGLEEGEQVVTAAHFMLDSESSKTSDFKRMHQGDNNAAKPASVWVEASVVATKPQQKMLTLAHKPVDAWGWPAMTMDFVLAEGVAMPDVTEGTVMHVEIRDDKGQFPITGIHIPDGQTQSQHQGMDHSQHQGMSQSEMPAMDHSQHQGMNQSAMPVMDHSQHQGMNQSEMPAMDHSQHQGMNQSEMPAMDHSQHQGMNQSAMPAMDHSQHQGMNQSEMPAMDHSQHQGMETTEKPVMDHSQHRMQGDKP